MKRIQLGATDLRVSTICYGGGGFGSQCRGADLASLLSQYRRAGGNFVDTAHCYAFWLPEGAGCSERAIGEYLRRNGRDDLVVATKGGHSALPGYVRLGGRHLSPAQIAADLDDSLRNLGLDCIPLYWLHRDDTRMPVADIVETLNAEVRRGRIRFLGASNWHHSRLQAANAYAAEHGLQGFCASSPEWNLARKNGDTDADPGPQTGTEVRFLREADHDWHRKTQLPVVPYSAAAGGYFASGGRSAAGVYDNETSQRRLGRARALASRRGVTPGQIALAWLMNQDIPVFPITGPLNASHLAENLLAATIPLNAETLSWLTE